MYPYTGYMSPDIPASLGRTIHPRTGLAQQVLGHAHWFLKIRWLTSPTVTYGGMGYAKLQPCDLYWVTSLWVLVNPSLK